MLIAMMILCAFSTFAFAEGEPVETDPEAAQTDLVSEEPEAQAPSLDAAAEDAVAVDKEDAKIEVKEESEPADESASKLSAKAVITVTAVSEAGGSAKVSWPDATGTTFSVTPNKDGAPLPAVTGITAKEYTFTGLAAGKYTFTVADETGSTAVSNEVTVTIAKPVVTAYSSYESVALEWDAVAGADHYEVYKDGVCVEANVLATAKAYDSDKIAYIVKKVKDEQPHIFNVVAVASDGAKSDQSDNVSEEQVRRMYINITFNQNRRLTSHDKYKKSRTFKAGQRVKAHGFGGGKYKFNYEINGKEYLFYVSFLRTKNAKAIYNKNKKDNYSAKEAEYFINTAKQGSKTKYYFWVSQYSQHVYVFKGSKGNWRICDDWDCSTGAAATPSPVGFGKKIYKKTANRHGLGPWTSFQSWTSFHGSKKSWKKLWGKPVSHACIRCPSDKAMWIYKKVPLKTAVGVY